MAVLVGSGVRAWRKPPRKESSERLRPIFGGCRPPGRRWPRCSGPIGREMVGREFESQTSASVQEVRVRSGFDSFRLYKSRDRGSDRQVDLLHLFQCNLEYITSTRRLPCRSFLLRPAPTRPRSQSLSPTARPEPPSVTRQMDVTLEVANRSGPEA